MDLELNRIEENIYEIPQDEQMNVPARVYASEKLLEEMKDDDALEQVRNMATIPGIQKYSIVMPDGHQGYGFPIGGVAAFDMEDGVISPGGVGFDINCLTADSEVLMEFGRKRNIEDFREDFNQQKAVVSTKDEAINSKVQLFTKTENREVFELETETGEKIKATADHPFLTDDGMKELSELKKAKECLSDHLKV